MDVSCQLSHLVYAELYRLLANDGTLADMLDERLGEIELDHYWLTEAAGRYEAKWQDLLRHSTGWQSLTPLSWEHARLASWVLAALRTRGSCSELSIELRTRVTRRAVQEVDGLPDLIPARWKPVIFAWALGMVTGQIDHDLPAVPPTMPADENITAAYAGLLEHVLLLGALPAPWPEMTATSVHWRGSGLLEALQPEARNAPEAIQRLVPAIKRYLPEPQARRLGQHFSCFVDPRNSLTHIADTPNKPRFVEVIADWGGELRVKDTVLGVTHLLFAQYSAGLAESHAVHAGLWPDLNWDLEVYEGNW